MSAGPGCGPCTKRPRWGAAATSPPAASDSRSFPGRQRRVLDPKDASVQFRVPPSSSGCVSGRAGPHRGSATSLGTWGNKDLRISAWPTHIRICPNMHGLQSPLYDLVCTAGGPLAKPPTPLVGEWSRIFPVAIDDVRNPDELVAKRAKMAGDHLFAFLGFD